MRTTVNIDDPILREVKKLQKARKTSLGRVISDLLARSLHELRAPRREARAHEWVCRDMGARVDIADKDALYAAMERPGVPSAEERET